MGRAPCCSKVGLRRGPWSTKEDTILTNYIQLHGEGQWRSLPKNAGLLRCGKSCRLRWMNYLRPGIKRGDINQDEEDLIVRLHSLLGNRWSLIAGRLPGRTDNEIKNYWNTHLLKKLKHNKIPIKPPKQPKTKKSTAEGGGAAAGKRKNKKQKKADEKDDNADKIEGEMNDGHNKIKVYVPKPIRVSSGFSRTTSYESLGSGSTTAASCDDGEKVAWTPLFDQLGGGDGDDIMGCEFILPLLQYNCCLDDISCSDDVNMLEKVYDEYLKLL